MIATPLLVQAEQTTSQVVTCSITDRLLERFSISVVFFYREELSPKLLITSLRKVLVDFSIFSGRLKIVDDNLLIDCNNQGVQFSLCFESCSLVRALKELSQTNLRNLIDPLIAKDVLAGQSPLLTIRLTQFDCGGTALGICWHHSIGDMHTFMHFMKAWSAATNREHYDAPLVIEHRNAYLQERIAKDESVPPNVKYLRLSEMLRLTLYMLTTARKKTSIKICFSDSELENMKQVFLEKTGQALSKNDVLCAHMFSIITDLDDYEKDRFLAIAIDYRSRLGLSQNLLGNMFDSINVLLPQRASPFEAARAIRAGVNNLETNHLSIMSTYQYVQDHGGPKQIQRFLSKSIDPIRRSIAVTNWSKFGVYDIRFLGAKPLYFTSVDDFPVPWICTIMAGFSNRGLIYSAHLPTELVQKFKQPNNLKKLHQYRDSHEDRSAQIEHLP